MYSARARPWTERTLSLVELQGHGMNKVGNMVQLGPRTPALTLRAGWIVTSTARSSAW